METLTPNSMLLSAVGVLATVVSVLYVQLRSTDKRQQAELDACKKECADDRARFWDLLVRMLPPNQQPPTT